MNRFAGAKAANPAEIYNTKRRIILSRFGKDPAEARRWLEGYRKALGPKGYAGLDAELRFFETFRREMKLVPSLDVGDATDFAGSIDGRMHRIDVTTNLDFKRLETYEPLQAEGDLYKIAVYDGRSFELVDVNFPFCRMCKEGRVLPTAILLGENHDREGISRWSHDQILVNICGACGDYECGDRVSTSYMGDFSLRYQMLNEANNEAEDEGGTKIDVEAEIQAYAASAMRHLRNEFGQFLVAIGGPNYQTYGYKGQDGHWAYEIVKKLPLVQSALQDSYPWEIEDS